jgi:hypothetical protein
MAEQLSIEFPEPEEWRIVPGHPAYEASSQGRIRRIKAAKGATVGSIRNPYVREDGYAQVVLSVPGNKQSFLVHAVICMVFHGPRPTPTHQVAHWDGNRLNNRASNLRWATSQENVDDTKRHGHILVGERNAQAKLTEDEVREIRRRFKAGETPRELALVYGMTRSGIRGITEGHNWKCVPD